VAFFGARPSGWLTDRPAEQAADIIAWAERAEEMGFDVVYVGDRLLASAKTTEDVSTYQGTMLEPFVLLSAIAARTRRVRLATLVHPIPFRHPAQMAKLTASLDIISNGRLIVGAGSGWSPAELAMLHVDPKRRGVQMEVGLRLLRQFWTGAGVRGDGEFWDFDEVRVSPIPVQQPGPPVWFASISPEDGHNWSGELSATLQRVHERIGRIGDGWAPLTYSAAHHTQIPAAKLLACWNAIAAGAEAAGRNPDDIDIIYPHWMAIVRNGDERRNTEETLSRFFPGDYDEARKTYLIGTPDEIAEQIRSHTALLPRVDGYLFTPISDDPEQLELIQTELRPRLEGGR